MLLVESPTNSKTLLLLRKTATSCGFLWLHNMKNAEIHVNRHEESIVSYVWNFTLWKILKRLFHWRYLRITPLRNFAHIWKLLSKSKERWNKLEMLPTISFTSAWSHELLNAKIDLSDLTAGIYLMTINTDKGVSTEKIVKK